MQGLKLAGDKMDPNSFLHEGAGHGMHIWFVSNCSVTIIVEWSSSVW